MGPPEVGQHGERGIGQGHEAVLVALAVAHMHPRPFGVNVADLETQALAEAQPEAVQGEVEDAVAEDAGGIEQTRGFGDRHDVRQPLGLGRIDQLHRDPGLAQDMRVEELQAVKIELHRTPRMRFQEIGEVLEKLRFGEILDTVVEVGTDAPNGAGISLDGLGLQALEPEMLEVGLVLVVEVGRGCWSHGCAASRFLLERPLSDEGG